MESCPIPYLEAMDRMDGYVAAVAERAFKGVFWLLEHPHVYTVGARTPKSDIINSENISVVRTKRGGKATYHGPGQRIGYVIINLKELGITVNEYVRSICKWLVSAVHPMGLYASIGGGNVGVWVGDSKLASIGIRVHKGITSHGFALNVSTDLQRFEGIIPCGSVFSMTSLRDLGVFATMEAVDSHLVDTSPFI